MAKKFFSFFFFLFCFSFLLQGFWYEEEDLFKEEKGLHRAVILNDGTFTYGKLYYNQEDNYLYLETTYGKLKFRKSQVLWVYSPKESDKIKNLMTALKVISSYQKSLRDYMIKHRIKRLNPTKPYAFLMLAEGFYDTIPYCRDNGKLEIFDREEPLVKCSVHGTLKHIIHQLRDIYGKAFYRYIDKD